ATPEDYAEDVAAALRAAGAEAVLSLSSVTGAGVTQMLRRLIGIIEDAVAEENRPEEEPWSP
ncbi:MAG: GTPase ObgE, partial [Candidatus Puniceispirillaceae bacterium]